MVEFKENMHVFQYMFFNVFIIYSFIYLRLLSINSPKESDLEFLIKVMDYWKKKPIWKMKVINENQEEPTDYEKIFFWNMEWYK